MSHRILVVEDEPDIRFLWKSMLERAGYDVLDAGNARAAIEAARACSPDLIVLDGHLPDRSGWSVLEEFSSDPILSRIPVVMVSGETTQEATARGYDAGAVRYLSKPVAMADLLAALRDALA